MKRDLRFEVTYPHSPERVWRLEPPRRLAYTWHGGWLGRPTMVTYTLEAVPGGTRLRLEHTGFQGLAGLALSQLLGSGWNSRILRVTLPRVLDRMREESTPEKVS